MSTLVNAYGGSFSGYSDTDSLAQSTFKKISLQNGILTVPRALPPPKWKLCLVIVTAVYSALLVVSLSGSVDAMLAADMPIGLVLFLSICHTVTLLSYAGLPLLMSIPCVNSWLRMKRRCEPSQMHPLHAVLDQGFQIFSVKLKPHEVPKEVLDKITKLEVRVDKLLGMNANLQKQMNRFSYDPENPSNSIENEEEYSPAIIEDVRVNNVEKMVGSIESHRESQSAHRKSELDSPLTMACRHYVKWEYQNDFENWCKEMDAEMKK